eukprot:1181857-Prorocentrum_minimum.AAC.1
MCDRWTCPKVTGPDPTAQCGSLVVALADMPFSRRTIWTASRRTRTSWRAKGAPANSKLKPEHRRFTPDHQQAHSSPAVHRCLKRAHHKYVLGTTPRLQHTEPSSCYS